jgi:hypothetical protein
LKLKNGDAILRHHSRFADSLGEDIGKFVKVGYLTNNISSPNPRALDFASSKPIVDPWSGHVTA